MVLHGITWCTLVFKADQNVDLDAVLIFEKEGSLTCVGVWFLCVFCVFLSEGMNALFTVEDCPEPVTIRPPDRRQVNPNNDDKDYIDYYGGGDYGNGEELFSTLVLKPVKVTAEGRSSQGGRSKTWVHYIAAEEVNWDYAPHLRPGDK